MLLQIRDYFKQHQMASNQQVARHFQMDEEALQPMLDIWLQKGVIVPSEEKPQCKSPCQKCLAKKTVYYRYA